MGRTKLIESPERLKELFNEYVKWTKDNPFMVHDYVGKDADSVERRKQRPITWIGFEAWLDREGIITHLGHYEQDSSGSYTDYLPIIRACKKQCSSDIIDGALAGIYNQNIAARLEGLADKKEVDKIVKRIKFTDAAG